MPRTGCGGNRECSAGHALPRRLLVLSRTPPVIVSASVLDCQPDSGSPRTPLVSGWGTIEPIVNVGWSRTRSFAYIHGLQNVIFLVTGHDQYPLAWLHERHC